MTQVIKKNQDLKKVEQAVKLSHRLGIKVGCFFIIGLIGETKEDIRTTINYAWKLKGMGADRFYFSYAMPQYGSELYDQAKRGGFLTSSFCDEDLAAVQPLIETPDFTTDDLRELITQANLVNPTVTRNKIRRAIRNPSRLFRMLLWKKINEKTTKKNSLGRID